MLKKQHLYSPTAILSLLSVLVLNAYPSFAQKAISSLDTSTIRIGEQVQLRLHATLHKNAHIYWPAIPDTLTSHIEVLNRTKVDTNATTHQDFIDFSQALTITSFDSGVQYIPPFVFAYTDAGDITKHQLLTDAVYLKVTTVAVDTTRSIKDIKGNMSAPLTFSETLPYIGMAALIAVIAALVWYYFRQRKLNKPLFPVINRPVGPPWQSALQNLEELNRRKLWQNGKTKEYYTELTDILRRYMSEQFGIEAMEMITSEIIERYDEATLPTHSKPLLSQVLLQADFVKFAKEIPQPQANERSMSNSVQFVQDTKPLDKVVDKAESEKQESNSELKDTTV